MSQDLSRVTDPDVKKYVYELNSAIAQWCIAINENIKNDV